MKEADIYALIYLLEDSDKTIVSHVQKKLIEGGNKYIPILEAAWESEVDVLKQNKIGDIIRQIKFLNTKEELRNWIIEDSNDILKATLLINQLYFPSLNIKQIENSINGITNNIWIELEENINPIEKVKIINHILFEIHQFKSEKINFNSPSQAFINHLLNNKTGNSINLSIFYLIIAQKLNISIKTINLPNQHILAYTNQNNDFSFIDKEKVLFYINPYNQGTFFSKKEIDNYLINSGHNQDISYYEPYNNNFPIQQLLLFLKTSFSNIGETEKYKTTEELLKLFI